MRRGSFIKAVFLAVLSFSLLQVQPAHAVNYTLGYHANATYVGNTVGTTPFAVQPGVTTGTLSDTQTAVASTVITVASQGSLARQGFDFAGWNTAADGTGTTYAAGSSITLNANTTLFAIWTVPLAARLIGSGGTMVTVSDTTNIDTNSYCKASGVRGITSDGTYIYYRSSVSPGVICKVTTSGAMVSVNSVSSNAGVTALASVGGDSIALVYGNGCLFLRKDTSATLNAIYCIQISNWTMYSISLPSGKDMPVGSTWLYGNFIQFPDGRIGSVSAPTAATTFNTNYPSATACPAGKYCKLLRLYNVSGTGSGVTTTYSTDFVLQDDTNFPGDDHGIATDGTYLYQIQHIRGYKVWALQSTGISYLVFNGDGTGSCGASTGVTATYCQITYPVDGNSGTTANKIFGNGTYLGRAHALNSYLIGDYSPSGNARFYLSAGVAPPPGPGNPDIVAPTFTSGTSFTTAENVPTSTNIATINVSESATLTISGGADNGFFNIVRGDTATAYVRFTASPDYEARADSGGDNVYNITLRAVDGAGNASTQSIAITVTNVNESGFITSPSVSDQVYKGVVAVLTVTSNTPGKVQFLVDGKRIPKCLAQLTTGSYPSYVATCSWKPPVTAYHALSAEITPSDQSFAGAVSAKVNLWVFKRTTTR